MGLNPSKAFHSKRSTRKNQKKAVGPANGLGTRGGAVTAGGKKRGESKNALDNCVKKGTEGNEL